MEAAYAEQDLRLGPHTLWTALYPMIKIYGYAAFARQHGITIDEVEDAIGKGKKLRLRRESPLYPPFELRSSHLPRGRQCWRCC